MTFTGRRKLRTEKIHTITDFEGKKNSLLLPKHHMSPLAKSQSLKEVMSSYSSPSCFCLHIKKKKSFLLPCLTSIGYFLIHENSEWIDMIFKSDERKQPAEEGDKQTHTSHGHYLPAYNVHMRGGSRT